MEGKNSEEDWQPGEREKKGPFFRRHRLLNLPRSYLSGRAAVIARHRKIVWSYSLDGSLEANAVRISTERFPTEYLPAGLSQPQEHGRLARVESRKIVNELEELPIANIFGDSHVFQPLPVRPAAHKPRKKAIPMPDQRPHVFFFHHVHREDDLDFSGLLQKLSLKAPEVANEGILCDVEPLPDTPWEVKRRERHNDTDMDNIGFDDFAATWEPDLIDVSVNDVDFPLAGEEPFAEELKALRLRRLEQSRKEKQPLEQGNQPRRDEICHMEASGSAAGEDTQLEPDDEDQISPLCERLSGLEQITPPTVTVKAEDVSAEDKAAHLKKDNRPIDPGHVITASLREMIEDQLIDIEPVDTTRNLLKDVTGRLQPKFRMTSVFRELLDFIECISCKTLSELRVIDPKLLSMKCGSIAQLNSNLSRQLLTEYAAINGFGVHDNPKTAFQAKALADYTFIHGLVKAREILMNGSYQATLEALKAYDTTHRKMVKDTYMKLIEMLETAVSSREPHPKVKGLAKFLYKLFGKDCVERVVILVPHATRATVQELTYVLKKIRIPYLHLTHEGTWIEAVQLRQIVVLAGADQQAYNFIPEYFSCVVFYAENEAPARPRSIEEALSQSELPKVALGPVVKEKVDEEPTKRAIVVEKSCLKSNPELAQKLKNCSRLQVYERDYNSRGENCRADILIDPETAIVIVPASAARSSSSFHRVYSTAFNCSRCLVLFKDSPESFTVKDVPQYRVEDVLRHCRSVSTQIPSKWSAQVKILHSEEEIYSVVMAAIMERQPSEWDSLFREELRSAEAQMLSRYPSLNTIVANIIAEKVLFSSLEAGSCVELAQSLPPCVPLEAVQDIWERNRLKRSAVTGDSPRRDDSMKDHMDEFYTERQENDQPAEESSCLLFAELESPAVSQDSFKVASLCSESRSDASPATGTSSLDSAEAPEEPPLKLQCVDEDYGILKPFSDVFK